MMGKTRVRGLGPRIEDGSEKRPGRFDSVAVRKKRSVAQHGIEKQPLVAVCGRFAECIFVLESRGDLRKVRGQSRWLDSELKTNAIIWLNAERYDIRLRFADTGILFEQLGR